MGRKTPGRICTKLCAVQAIRDVITDANFWDDGLRRFLRGEGSNFRLFNRLSRSSLYNTLALPCEMRMCDKEANWPANFRPIRFLAGCNASCL